MVSPPLRPRASRSSSISRDSFYQDVGEDRQATQAGRTPGNLAAHASAQSLRESARSSTRPSSRSAGGNVLRTKSSRPDSQSGSSSNVVPFPETQPPPPNCSTPRPAHSHEPAVSSPLGPTSSSRKNSDESRESTSAGSSSSGRTKAATVLAAQLASGMPSSTASRQLHSRHPEMTQADSSLNLTRQSTPRTLRDLGSDYTRYYNPFASRNNSQQDLGTPLPRYHSSTHLMAGVSGADLQNRLSNPFQDIKRLSDPFASKPQTLPGSPLQPQRSPGEGGKTAADVGALPVMVPPMKPGTPNFIREADPEKAGFFQYMDDRLGAPEYAFPLFSDDKEDDDDLHMPQWDDDVRLKPKLKDHFTRGNIVNTLGLIFIVLGLLCVFIVLPVLSYTTVSLIDYTFDTPLSQMPQNGDQPQAWATVNNRTYPLLTNLRTGLIDPDTPSSAKTKKGVDGDEYVLVFSDEFNAQNRTFYPGDDAYWFGLDAWYGATQDLEWYTPDALNTGEGVLQIQLDKFPTHGLDYRSGMMNSWNQLCFKGGIFEVSMSLPGPAGVHSWWPGVWTMGNLGRPGYLSTTDGMWPYTYNTCDVGITPNQSSPDGLSYLPGQRLPSCTCAGEDHPTPGTGRGAPEIDIAEVSANWGGQGWAVATQSFQVAPFDIWWYPNYEFMQTPNYNVSMVNTYTGGPYQQAVSTTSMLNNNWYDGKEYQTYAYEYAPGDDENAYIAWSIGGEEMMKFDARAVGPNGNINQRIISEEPMSIIMNLGFSNNWVDIDWPALVFPTVMRIDYVRWYQKDGQQMVTCDPPGYETTDYIAKHPEPYNNPNLTHWTDSGYSWPQNTFMNGCSA